MVLRALLLSSTLLFSGLSEAAPKPVEKPRKPARIVLFHANNTVSIEELDATSIALEPRGDSPDLGLEADGKKIVLQRGIITTWGAQTKRFELGERITKAILWSEDVPVMVQIGWPRNLASRLKNQWRGLERFAWSEGYTAGQFSMGESLLFNRRAKTLDKSLDVRIYSSKSKLEMRFHGVTPEMLDAASQEQHPREEGYGGDWGRELYLPKYGATAEILRIQGSVPLPVQWNQWKARVTWRVPRP